MNRLKCMVVDDEPLAVDVVVDYLQKWDIHPEIGRASCRERV